MSRAIRRPTAAVVAAATASALVGCSAPVLRTYPVTPAASSALPSGQPSPTPSASATASPSDAFRDRNYTALLLGDQRVPNGIKDTLRTCPDASCIGDIVLVDVTGDGVPEVIVLVEGGNGPAGQVVYTSRAGAPTLILAHYGFGGWIEPRGADLVLTQRMYASSDAACCPSGRDRVSTYRWAGDKLHLVSRTGGSPGTAPYDPEDVVVL